MLLPPSIPGGLRTFRMMMTDDESDSDLLARAREGDALAFSQLLKEYLDGLYAFLARSTGDQDEADDLLQLTVIRVWRGLASYEERGRFRSWLFTVARSVMIDEERRKARRPVSALREIDGRANPDPHEVLAAREMEGSLVAELKRLPEVRRTVFLMRHHSAMTFQEIAEALGIPIGTALSHMHHAIRSLRAALERDDVTVG